MNKAENALFKGTCLCVQGIIVSCVLGLEGLCSVIFHASFVLAALLWLSSLGRGLDRAKLCALGIILAALGCVTANALASGVGLSFSYLKKYLMFSLALMFLSACGGICADEKQRSFFLGCCTFGSVFLCAAYLPLFAENHSVNGVFAPYLTFGFGNPNMAGMFLVCLFMAETAQLSRPRKIAAKLCHLILWAALLAFIFETGARNCIITAMLFCLFAGAARVKKRVSPPGRAACAVAALWPLIFAAAYMLFVPSMDSLFPFLSTEGKPLDSRLEIWSFAMEAFADSPIIGDYWRISGGAGSSQMHNSHLDVLASYGLICFGATVWFLYLLLRRGNLSENGGKAVFMLGFLCCLLLGVGEAALFSGGLGFYLFAGQFLLLSGEETE